MKRYYKIKYSSDSFCFMLVFNAKDKDDELLAELFEWKEFKGIYNKLKELNFLIIEISPDELIRIENDNER